jgi:hypothetical protein
MLDKPSMKTKVPGAKPGRGGCEQREGGEEEENKGV